ncbi:MAG: ribonuclease III [Candidatus Omnitrophica bacterium]|nr:ribonuclease III [Candidatus Omnitrophota bacterium]
MQEIIKIEKKCGYKFKDPGLLITALTHSSYAHRYLVESNERLEFLGDAVLNFVVSAEIFKKNPLEDEQFLTELKSAYVNKNFLQKVGKKLSLGEGLRHIGLKDPRLDQVLESLIGAIYLDGGFVSAKKFIKKFILSHEIAPLRDYKGLLKTIAYERFGVTPDYKVKKIYGPPHRRRFLISVSIKNSRYLAQATGKTKKEAELKASMLLLNKIKKS